MSTKSLIGVHNKVDNTVDCIYCHFDGYVDHSAGVGQLLRIHYNTFEKAQTLLELGDISALAETIESCDAYNDNCKARTVRFDEYNKDSEFTLSHDYLYLLKEDTDGYMKWFYQTADLKEFELVTADLVTVFVEDDLDEDYENENQN